MPTTAERIANQTGQAGLTSPCATTPAPPSVGPAFCTVSLAGPSSAQATLSFAQPGRSYSVTVTWPVGLNFLDFALAAKVSRSVASEWTRDDSMVGSNQYGWTAYIPTNAGPAYTALTMNVSAVAKGYWNNPSNLNPVCTWTVSAPIL